MWLNAKLRNSQSPDIYIIYSEVSIFTERMNERTTDRPNERTNERTNKRRCVYYATSTKHPGQCVIDIGNTWVRPELAGDEEASITDEPNNKVKAGQSGELSPTNEPITQLARAYLRYCAATLFVCFNVQPKSPNRRFKMRNYCAAGQRS